MVDLGVAAEVTGVMTQGREGADEWVTAFSISYSRDANEWETARDVYGSPKIFKGNVNAFSPHHSYLEHPVTTRFVRLHVVAWHRHPSLRLEIIGCQECNRVISVQPFTEMAASSHKRWSMSRRMLLRRRRRRRHHGSGHHPHQHQVDFPSRSCLPEMADLDSPKGWCPRKQNGEAKQRL